MLAERKEHSVYTRLALGRRGGLAKVNISTSLTFKVKDVENRGRNFLSLGPSSLSQRELGGMPLTYTSPFLRTPYCPRTLGVRLQCQDGLWRSHFWSPLT